MWGGNRKSECITMDDILGAGFAVQVHCFLFEHGPCGLAWALACTINTCKNRMYTSQ
jgi:hypothetical protein